MKRILAHSQTQENRRGIAILWLILWGSVFLTFFCVVLEFATLWQAHVELNKALDAAALAAVKEWGASGGVLTETPRNSGVTYAASNTVLGDPVVLGPNYDFSNPVTNPNQNASCDGNLVFGRLSPLIPPFTFNAGLGATTGGGTVFMEIDKPNSGDNAQVRNIGVFFDSSLPGVSIRTIKITMPTFAVNVNQRPYFSPAPIGSNAPALSTAMVGPDTLNRFNLAGFDYRGLDIDPNAMSGNWYCDPAAPPFTLMGMNTNPDGDICFEMDDLVSTFTDRYRSLIIHFTDGAFTSTQNPLTTDFFRFGVSINNLDPPALPGGTSNDGDAWHLAPVGVEITFYDSGSMTSTIASGVFVDDLDPNNGRSILNITTSVGVLPAVRAQATVPVQTFCSSLFGVTFFNVSAKSTAYYDFTSGRVALVSVQNYICP